MGVFIFLLRDFFIRNRNHISKYQARCFEQKGENVIPVCADLTAKKTLKGQTRKNQQIKRSGIYDVQN